MTGKRVETSKNNEQKKDWLTADKQVKPTNKRVDTSRNDLWTSKGDQ